MQDKKRILFVDDEPRVLADLGLMLESVSYKWDVALAGSGEEALEVLRQSPFDVVVSDLRMPNMDGVQLLAEIEKRHPRIARVILSGQSDKAAVSTSIGSTHQFLAKPFDVERLMSAVGRACAMCNLMSNDAVRRLVSQMDAVPSLPLLYLEILDELESPMASMARVGSIISRDIGMTAKILHLVNSAFFGLPQRLSSPTLAAMLLGVDTIRAFLLSAHVFSEIETAKLREFQLDRLWNHSINTAVYAREIAKVERQNRKLIDEAFVAGLLHDVGKLSLVTKLPSDYRQVLNLILKENVTAYVAESEVFGTTHAEIGGYVLGLWGLPDSVVDAVRSHHYPMGDQNPESVPLMAVHVANVLEAQTHASNVAQTLSQIDSNYLTEIGKANRLSVWTEVCAEITKNREHDNREDSAR
jgi:HD-like signal output (HDOD) protein